MFANLFRMPRIRFIHNTTVHPDIPYLLIYLAQAPRFQMYRINAKLRHQSNVYHINMTVPGVPPRVDGIFRAGARDIELTGYALTTVRFFFFFL